MTTDTSESVSAEEKQALKREIKQAILEDRELLAAIVKRELKEMVQETADKFEGYPSRRDVLTAGGAAGVSALAIPLLAGKAAAAPQGDLGTSTTPWDTVFATNIRHPTGELSFGSDTIQQNIHWLDTGKNAAILYNGSEMQLFDGNNNKRLALVDGGPVDLSGQAADLRLALGQSLEWGNDGTPPQIYEDAGEVKADDDAGNTTTLT